MSSSAEDQDWVIKINNEAARRRDSDVIAETEQWKKRSIYRIPASFTDVNKKAYKPQAVSFGPYHHGEEHLKAMEVHKHRALVRFLRRSGKPLEDYLHALEPLVQDLKDAYDTTTTLPGCSWQQQVEEDDERISAQFLQLMILDGCFMLEILRTGSGSPKYCLGKDDYAPNDPVFSDHGKLYLIPHLRRDMLVLQNQLPMLLLYTLHAVDNNVDVVEEEAVEFMNDLVIKIWNPNNSDPKKNLGKCLHVLDLYRKNLLWEPANKYSRKRQQHVNKRRGAREAARRRRRGDGDDQIIRSATELYEAGIRFKKSKTQSLTDISFRWGVLRLPPITVDDTSESMFLNLIAFERSHVGAGNEVTSYIFFMDNIIDSSKDVSLLHSSGIIQNAIGSDKAVAKLFNSLSKDITLDPDSSLDVVQNEVSHYCQKAWNEWRANLIHTYFRSPWAILSVIAAIFLFALTIVQTVYTVLPYYTNSNS
nr:UPF0481 protein At3g47200-like [Ipomoea trifida]